MVGLLRVGSLIFGGLLILLSVLVAAARPPQSQKTYLQMATASGRVYTTAPDGREIAFVGYQMPSARRGDLLVPRELSNGRWTLYWDEEGLYRMPAQGEGQREILGIGLDIGVAAASPDRNWLAIAVCLQRGGQRCLSGYAALVNVNDGDLRLLEGLTFRDNFPLLSWSPDGRWLLYAASRDIHYLTFEGNHQTEIQKITLSAAFSRVYWMTFTWSPDSQWLYFIGSRRSPFIDIYRIPAGTPNPEVNGLSYNQRFVWLGQLRVSPDGKWVLVSTDNSDNYLLHADESGQRFRKPILEPTPSAIWLEELPERVFAPGLLGGSAVLFLLIGFWMTVR